MILVPYADFKVYIEQLNITHLVRYVHAYGTYYLAVEEGGMHVTTEIGSHEAADLADFTMNLKPHANKPKIEHPAFKSKKDKDGNLFARNEGKEYALSVGNNTLEFAIPYPHVKFNEVEIIGGEKKDKVTLKILDTATGTYTGVPNYQLNQFGNKVGVAKDFYVRKNNYDADLYQGMRIILEYTSVSAKDIDVNFVLHEVK